MLILSAGSSSVSLVDPDEPIAVENFRAIGTDRLAAARMPIGITNDYNPSVAPGRPNSKLKMSEHLGRSALTIDASSLYRPVSMPHAFGKQHS